MITLKTLKWDNCFSYGEGNILDLSEHKITQILGTNGVGKSSIPLILEEVLFNKNSKGIKKADIQNRLIEKGYNISLAFSKDADEYDIDLARRGATIKVKLFKNGDDISSHTATNTYKNIEEILGIDFRTFSQVVYQNTNSSLNFLTATDANRKKFLIDLLGLEQYVELFEVFKTASRDVEQEFSKLEGKIATIERWLESNKLFDTNPKEIQPLPTISSDDQEEMNSLAVELSNISATNKQISKNNQLKDLLRQIPINEIRDMPDDQVESYDSYQAKLGEIKTIVSSAKKLIDKMEDLGNVCPTCEQSVPEQFKLDHIHKEKEKITEQEGNYKSIQTKIREIQEKNERALLRAKKIKEWEDLYRSIKHDMPTRLLDEDELQDRLSAIKVRIKSTEAQIAKISRENNDRASHNAKISVIQEQTESFKGQMSALQVDYDTCNSKRANLEVLKKAFSTNGLVAYKIENLVKELEELTSNYLSELSDGRFTLNFTVSNDKLNVEITDNGNVIDILALSSGELARVNIATLLGIRKLMSSLSSSKINVLFLDEVMNVLDELGREKLVDVLLNEELNTYIVSHQWSHPLLNKIEVQKTRGISGIIL
jgi:DNA repair exonuclease SbcCD ATPase subunit